MSSPVQSVDIPGYGTTWLITGYDEARAALADPRLSRDDRKAPARLREQAERHQTESSLGRNMLDADPPEHTRLRRLVNKAFTPRRVESLRPRVEQITDELLDAITPHSEASLIETLAFPLPVTVICELLGLPMADRAEFRSWTADLALSLDPAADPEPVRTAGAALRAYFEKLLAGIRLEAVPEDEQPDLTRALLRATGEGGELGRDELISMLMLLLLAGHETTVNLISNALANLLTNLDQFELLRAKPELVPQAVEELLRLEGPLQTTLPRITLADVEIGGTTIPAGNMVNVVLSAANRDAARIDDPDRLDVTRGEFQHLAFGHGPHFCLGAALARLEAQVAIRGLLTRFPNLSLAVRPSELRWRTNPMLRALDDLPVRFNP